MKELSVEEKAKRYDEAIKKLRTMRDAWNNLETDYSPKDVVHDIEYYFPELTESEDERIRKDIIFFLSRNTFQFGEDIDKYKSWIAWLEKQGETFTILSNSLNIGKNKQKSTWSEEDEDRLNSCVDAINAVYKWDDMIAWLKSIKDRVQPQPKQEWSQNDIDMIDWLIRCCEKEHEELYNDKYGHQDIVSDLKRDCRKKWNWLESLKNKVVPQNMWKPSESDILLLERIANGESNPQDFQASLGGLIGQLKKLREE